MIRLAILLTIGAPMMAFLGLIAFVLFGCALGLLIDTWRR